MADGSRSRDSSGCTKGPIAPAKTHPSTVRPVQLSFSRIPDADELREALRHQIADDVYHDDVHGKSAWRKHMTLRLAEEIRAELQGLV